MAKKKVRVMRGDGWSMTIKESGIFVDMRKAVPEVNRQLGFAMRDIAHDIPSFIQKRMRDYAPSGNKRRKRIFVRSGKLYQSIRGHHRGSSIDDLQAIITAGGADIPYARVQEYGTVGAGGTLPDIRPKKKYLRMPMSSILTPRGAVKGDYELVERANSWQTAGGKETWISGRAIMIEEGGKPRPIWALMTESKIPPRLGMGLTIEQKGKWIRLQFTKAADRVLEGEK
jgi:hypothetical protein